MASETLVKCLKSWYDNGKIKKSKIKSNIRKKLKKDEIDAIVGEDE